MGKFELDQRVKVLAMDNTNHYGEIGIIEGFHKDSTIEVIFPNGDSEGFSEDELGFSAMGSTAAADDSNFYSEFERGWDGATQSMLDILERTLDNPEGGDTLRHIVLLVQNFRKTYPKHGKAQESAG